MTNFNPDWVKDVIPNQREQLIEIEELSQNTRCFNPLGYKVVKVPERIYSSIYQRYFENRFIYRNFQAEYPNHIVGNLYSLPNWVSGSIGHGDEYFNIIHTDSQFKEMHEDFAGCKLIPSMWYGPRIYVEGSYLRMHIDKCQTHYISSTITIDLELKKKFPLILKDKDKLIEINLEAQEMLLYEGVRFPHFRPYALDGKFYASIFFHYRPNN